MENKQTVLAEVDRSLNQLQEALKRKVERLYDSGGIDPESYLPEHPYALAEVLLTSVLRDHVDTVVSRLAGKVLSDYKNLKHF